MIPLNSLTFVASVQCLRKAYFLYKERVGQCHEYVQLVEDQKTSNQSEFIKKIRQKGKKEISDFRGKGIDCGSSTILHAKLQINNLEATIPILTRVEEKSALGKHSYEPTIFSGLLNITKYEKLELLFLGHVLGLIQNNIPARGTIVGVDGKSHRVKLNYTKEHFHSFLKPLQKLFGTKSSVPPQIVLNKHCHVCQFQKECLTKAKLENNISLLNGITPKVLQKYEKKGITTVDQLSYLYRLKRRNKKLGKKSKPEIHKFELQALAIRENKIFLQGLPKLPRQATEFFLDMEGIPDRQLYYLVGLLECQNQVINYCSFWADTAKDESGVWKQFLNKVNDCPDAPIYHYGNYERIAILKLAKRYKASNSCIEKLLKRLVNIVSFVFAKVYFPVLSNRLKDIGTFIGAKWTTPNASGLYSIVWRYRWENSRSSNYKNCLLTYNREDCEALRQLVNALTCISDAANSKWDIDFADNSKMQQSTTSKKVESDFEKMLKYAHAEYEIAKIKKKKKTKNQAKKDRATTPKNWKWRTNLVPKRQGKIIQVRRKVGNCQKHPDQKLRRSEMIVEKVVIDLHFSKSGCKKRILRYKGHPSFCPTCRAWHTPPGIKRLGRRVLGHNFLSMIMYQRVVLRMSFPLISNLIEELYEESVGDGNMCNYMKHFGTLYKSTEIKLLKRLLAGPILHVDETMISIEGDNQYVWVITDGKHVIFRKTETREASMIHKLLASYNGVLISDFYAAYDSANCRQQKCLSHLIGDINDDLRKEPFNDEYEKFVIAVRDLLVPILETFDIRGPKKIYLKKYCGNVSDFYTKNIDNQFYYSEVTKKYQKRFQRYKSSLFLFLEVDGVPWNNNMAERAIRHIAIQRKISGSFFDSHIREYLILLGIAQTCKFQKKSFLQFLISNEKDVDLFMTRIRHR